jgi:diadenylate cyclase
MDEKDKLMFEQIKKVAPGTALRTVIADILRSEMGAIIAFETPEIEKVIEGGFRVNCRFTPQRLFELCKMDGGIVISADMRRILYANVLFTPDASIPTNETGTRHKAAEKTAKQLNTLVITISERRKKTTLYYGNSKCYLRPTEEVFREITNTIQLLEKQREVFDDLTNKIGLLEITNMVSASDVCKIIQRSEIILRNSETLKKDFIEVGKEGTLMNLRFKELLKGVEKKEEELIRDYAKLSLKKTKLLLENLSFDGLIEIESIARLVFEKELDDIVSPRGYRFMSQLNISEKDAFAIVKEYHSLNDILNDDTNKMEDILKSNTINIKEEIAQLREKIAEGRVVL